MIAGTGYGLRYNKIVFNPPAFTKVEQVATMIGQADVICNFVVDSYGLDPNTHKQINQLTVYNDMDLDNLQSKIKIDLLTMEKKKDKTRYFCPGVTIVDTLLLYAKTASKEKNWSLDAIVQEELKDSKIPYKFEIFEFYMKDIRRFIKYSAVDTMLLLRLEEVLKF